MPGTTSDDPPVVRTAKQFHAKARGRAARPGSILVAGFARIPIARYRLNSCEFSYDPLRFLSPIAAPGRPGVARIAGSLKPSRWASSAVKTARLPPARDRWAR